MVLTALLEVHKGEEFHPYRLTLKGGRVLEIDRPERLSIHPGGKSVTVITTGPFQDSGMEVIVGEEEIALADIARIDVVVEGRDRRRAIIEDLRSYKRADPFVPFRFRTGHEAFLVADPATIKLAPDGGYVRLAITDGYSLIDALDVIAIEPMG
jgi:hypothetical protein